MLNLRPNTYNMEKVVVKEEADQSPDIDIYGNLVLVLRQKSIQNIEDIKMTFIKL